MARLDILTNRIALLDFASLRELAQFCLKIYGYGEPVVIDGWKDGGSDVRTFTIPLRKSPMAIQVSVHKKWKTKIKEDALKVQKDLNLSTFLYITSKRIPESEFIPLATDLEINHGIKATRWDNQSLASILVNNASPEQIQNILNFKLPIPEKALTPKERIRKNAAFAYVFFDKDAVNFRRNVIENSIFCVLKESSCKKKELIEHVESVLSLSGNQSFLVESEIDRLLQDSSIELAGILLSISDIQKERIQIAEDSRIQSEIIIREDISNLVASYSSIVKVKEDLIEGILENLGALVIMSAHSAANALAHQAKFADINQNIISRVQNLNALLDSYEFPEGRTRDRFVEAIVTLAQTSEFTKYLMSGELFLAMASQEPSSLLQAIRGNAEGNILLDASVLIPFLCSSLIKPTEHRYFRASEFAVTSAIEENIPVLVPDYYIQEAAGHLLLAWEKYRDIVNVDPDLEFSQNAFVGHYVGLFQSDDEFSFNHYLKIFGFDTSWDDFDRRVKIQKITRFMSEAVRQYGIRVVTIPRYPEDFFTSCLKTFSFELKRAGQDRHFHLIQDDAKTLCYLKENGRKDGRCLIFTTWDGIHQKIYETEPNPNWDCITPNALADLIALTSRGEKIHSLISPSVIAKQLHSTIAENGAQIWDVLVTINNGELHDAELIQKMISFKQKYLHRTDYQLDSKSISRAWQTWIKKN